MAENLRIFLLHFKNNNNKSFWKISEIQYLPLFVFVWGMILLEVGSWNSEELALHHMCFHLTCIRAKTVSVLQKHPCLMSYYRELLIPKTTSYPENRKSQIATFPNSHVCPKEAPETAPALTGTLISSATLKTSKHHNLPPSLRSPILPPSLGSNNLTNPRTLCP